MINNYTWKINGVKNNNDGIPSRVYWECLALNSSNNIEVSITDSISITQDGFAFFTNLSSPEAIQWLLNKLGDSSVVAIKFNLDNKINYLLNYQNRF